MRPETADLLARYHGTLDGAVAVVTGAGTGIGRGTAVALASAGADVALLGRRREPLDEAARLVRETGRRAFVAVADVADASEVEHAVRAAEAELGAISIAVASAGAGAWGELETLEPERLDRALRTNVSGVANLARAIVPGMKERGRGKLVVVASDAGKHPSAGGSGYTASKYGSVGFTLSLSRELYAAGIGVHLVEPGCVDTPWFDADPRAPRDRFLDPEDVALAILFLATLPQHVILEEIELKPRAVEVQGWD